MNCDNCGAEATHYCAECDENQCQKCIDSIHIGKRKTHLDTMKKLEKPKPVILKCDNCEEKDALYYCPDCKEKQCGPCMDSIHVGKRKVHLDNLKPAKSAPTAQETTNNKQKEIDELKVEKERLARDKEKEMQRLQEEKMKLEMIKMQKDHVRLMEEEARKEADRKKRDQDEKLRQERIKEDQKPQEKLETEQVKKEVKNVEPKKEIHVDNSGIKKITGRRENASSTQILKRNFPISSVTMDGELLSIASSQSDSPAQIYNLKEKDSIAQTFSCEQNGKFISIVKTLKSADLAAVGYSNGRVDVFAWSSKPGSNPKRKIGSLNEHRGVEIGLMELGSDGKNSYLFTVAKGKSTIIQSNPTKALKTGEYQEKAPIVQILFGMCFLFGEDIPVLLSAGSDGTLTLYNTLTGKVLKSIQAHQKQIDYIVMDQVGKDDLIDICATGSTDGTIGIWDMTLKNLTILKGHTQPVTCLASDGEYDRIVSGSLDSTARVWSLTTYQCLYILGPHQYNVSHLVIKNHLIYTCGGGGEIGVFNLDEENCEDMIICHNTPITSCFVYGGRVITGSQHDSTLRINGIGKTRLRESDD